MTDNPKPFGIPYAFIAACHNKWLDDYLEKKDEEARREVPKADAASTFAKLDALLK